jgi:hypothetical protein
MTAICILEFPIFTIFSYFFTLLRVSFSPDFNGIIEHTWREPQNRVLARANTIHSRADMKHVILEEWAGLEFGETAHWCGINKLVASFIPCLKEAVENGGWDTHYM